MYAHIRQQMTSIGRFSHDSETIGNPSVPTVFLALTGPKPFTASHFLQLWQTRDLSNQHPRLEQCIDDTQPGFFRPATKPLHHRVVDTVFPTLYRTDLAHRMAYLLTSPLPVHEALWEAYVATNNSSDSDCDSNNHKTNIGTSGAISKLKSDHLPSDHTSESLIMFRSHHALADGSSLVSAFLELCDEADDIKEQIRAELQKRKKKAKTILQAIWRWFQRFLWFCHGSIQASFYQMRLIWGMPRNPLELVYELSDTTTGDSNIRGDSGILGTAGRTVSWCDAAPLEQVKQVARAHGTQITINDIWVSCASYAMARQLEQHRKRLALRATTEDDGKNNRKKAVLPTFDHINIVVPVHLSGGVLLPGQSIGNFIGAFAARIPGETKVLPCGQPDAHNRLMKVHKTLDWVKRSPAPWIGYLSARTSSLLPLSWTKYLFRKASANACLSISNVRGSPTKLHMDGQTIQSMAGFLPLPPGIPVGVVVMSYAGVVSLTVTAQPWAVPDADQFLLWMLEEYQRLLQESQTVPL